MGEFRAAHRYALALIGVNEGEKELEDVGRDCEHLDGLISASRDFLLFLQSPVVNAQKKKRILDELFRGRVGKSMLTFLFLLVAKGREGLLPQVITEFFRLRDERWGVVNVTASVAVPLTPGQEERLIARLEQATKKTVRMKYVLDASLKAGFSLRLGDTVWDASIRHELESLRRRFIAGGA